MSVHSGWTNSDTVYGLWAGTLSGETCPNESWPTGIPLEEICRKYAAHAAQMDRWKRSLDQGLKEPGEFYVEWLVKNKTRPVKN